MTKKPKGKSLYVELKRDIQTVINEYCHESNIKKEDIGFAMGWLTGKLAQDPQGMDQLMFLLQIYFFSGVHYAKSTENFMYKYLTKEERLRELKKLNEKLASMMRPKPEDKPSYMG